MIYSTLNYSEIISLSSGMQLPSKNEIDGKIKMCHVIYRSMAFCNEKNHQISIETMEQDSSQNFTPRKKKKFFCHNTEATQSNKTIFILRVCG